MNKKLTLVLCSVVVCNAYAMEQPALETAELPVEAQQAFVSDSLAPEHVGSLEDASATTQEQTTAEPEERNPYSGIIDALLQARKTCKPSEALLKQNSLELLKQAQGHLMGILAEAFKSMDSDQRRICADIFSNLHELAADVKSTFNLANEPGRSEQEKQILWKALEERSTAQLFVLAMLFGPLDQAATNHAGLTKKIEKQGKKIEALGNNILAQVISVLDNAKQLASEDQEA